MGAVSAVARKLFGKEQHFRSFARLHSADRAAYDEPAGIAYRWMRTVPAGETP